VRAILITGSEGLVGTALAARLRARGSAVESLDLRLPHGHPGRADVVQRAAVEARVAGCGGIVHLAAVSRVVWAERDPERCWSTNVEGTANLLRAALAAAPRPWVVFASSREVYGEPNRLPVGENAALRPVNVYGRSKVEGERLVLEARRAGLRAAVVRFSNVYGSPRDHPDRVIPAFARGAVLGTDLRVEGSGGTFDFTHLDDTVEGVLRVIAALEAGAADLPAVHFCTGRATTLGELARLARRLGGGRARIVETPQRSYDVARFVGDPRRPAQLLGWQARIDLAEGLRRLVRDFRAAAPVATADASALPAWPVAPAFTT
jgi:nucleoside-diphosphate-sugar epimerase